MTKTLAPPITLFEIQQSVSLCFAAINLVATANVHVTQLGTRELDTHQRLGLRHCDDAAQATGRIEHLQTNTAGHIKSPR